MYTNKNWMIDSGRNELISKEGRNRNWKKSQKM